MGNWAIRGQKKFTTMAQPIALWHVDNLNEVQSKNLGDVEHNPGWVFSFNLVDFYFYLSSLNFLFFLTVIS